jgi:copper resistance protein D
MVTALIITRAVHIAASMLLAGTFTFDLVTLGLTDRSVGNDLNHVQRRLIRLAFWSLIAALLSALFWFCLEVASMNGFPLKNTFRASAWEMVLLGTRFGRVWQLRVGLIATALVLLRIPSTKREVKARKALIAVLWVVSVILLVSLGMISHAAAASRQPLGVLGDMIHLCAAGLWIGGLVPVVIFLSHRRLSLSLGELATMLQRFSTLGLCCVTVLIVSGISNGWLLVGSLHALFTTLYGRLLLFKLALFAILIGFGARNRFLVKAKLPKSTADPDLPGELRRNVLCEVCLSVAVVVIIACLGVTPPARHP